jgi:small subunit ribosomal protein S17e
MNRIKRISTEIMVIYKEKFGTDFAQNKKTLDQIAIVRSKGLKNEIAGYITTFIKREIEEQNEKDAQKIESAKSFDDVEGMQEVLN